MPPTRLDVIWGWKPIRSEMVHRMNDDGSETVFRLQPDGTYLSRYYEPEPEEPEPEDTPNEP